MSGQYVSKMIFAVLFLVLINCASAAVTTTATHINSTTPPSAATLFFAAYDTNPKDGVISNAEFHKAAYAYDTDGDGNITRSEFVTLYRASLGTSQHQAEGTFDAIDLNHDSTFDDKEITAVYKVFDANGDGQITPEEFLAGFSHFSPGHVTTSG